MAFCKVVPSLLYSVCLVSVQEHTILFFLKLQHISQPKLPRLRHNGPTRQSAHLWDVADFVRCSEALPPPPLLRTPPPRVSARHVAAMTTKEGLGGTERWCGGPCGAFPWHLASPPVWSQGIGDVLTVAQLLQCAGIASLDAPSPNNASQSLRYAGAVVLVYIEYATHWTTGSRGFYGYRVVRLEQVEWNTQVRNCFSCRLLSHLFVCVWLGGST